MLKLYPNINDLRMDIIKGASTTDIIIPSSQLIKLELQSAGNDPCIKEIVK